MESKFGMESMARDAAIGRMIPAYEREIQQAARTAHLLSQAVPARSAWYCPVLVCIGKALISVGTYLKTHFSVQSTVHAH